MKIIVTSGYYNPLHRGHLSLFREARNRFPADRIIVVVNNDKQVAAKNLVHDSPPFMDQDERLELVSAVKYIDHAIVATDEGSTVLETLERLKPDVFVKGGDSTPENTPELEWCEKHGVEVLFDVGGKKVQSSSWLKHGTVPAT